MGSKFIKFDSHRKGYYASSESDRPEETRAIHQNSKQAHVKQAPAPSSSKRSALPSPPSGNLHTFWRDESRTRFWYDRAISFTTICFWPENESGLVDLSGGRRIRALAGRLCSHQNRWKFQHLQNLERHIHSIIIHLLRRSGKSTSSGRRRSCPFSRILVNTPQQTPTGDPNFFVFDGLAEGVCVCFLLFLGGLASIQFLVGLLARLQAILRFLVEGSQVTIHSFSYYYFCFFFNKQSTILGAASWCLSC